MAHILVIGASTGGLSAAYEARSQLGDEHKITVVSNRPLFHFIPSNPWIAVGWRTRRDTTFEILPRLRAKNIKFLTDTVTEICADDSYVLLGDDSHLDYDYLIVSAEVILDFDNVEGLGPDGFTESICTLEQSEAAYEAWRQFIKKPGPIVIGAVQKASCFAPAYELAFILNHALRKAKIRNQVPITFVTAEPYLGHMGVAGIGDSKGLFESEFRMNDIKWIANARVKQIEAGKMLVEEVNAQAEHVKTHQLPFDYSMMMPAFKGPECLAGLDSAAINSRGFLKVNEYQQNLKYPNIFGVGTCVAIAPVEATPVAVGVPKTAYMIETMATAAVSNIKLAIEQKELAVKGTWGAMSLADLGHSAIAFVAVPQNPPRNKVWMKKSKFFRLVKKALEKYYIFKLKYGLTEPVYEKYIMKLLGLERLK